MGGIGAVNRMIDGVRLGLLVFSNELMLHGGFNDIDVIL